MDEPHSNIFVAGNYIASQTIGTQIIGGSHSHHYSSPDTHDTPYASRIAEDVEFEDVTPVETPTQAEPFPSRASAGQKQSSSITEKRPTGVREGIEYVGSSVFFK